MRTTVIPIRSKVHCQGLPALVGDCVFQAGPLLFYQGDCWKIEWLEFSSGSRVYQSLHSSMVQQLLIGTDDGDQVLLEMELIVGWSGQGGRPGEPWQKLLEIGRLLHNTCGVPLKELPAWSQICPGGPEGA